MATKAPKDGDRRWAGRPDRSRAAEYARMCGTPRAQAQAQGRTERRLQQITSSKEAPDVPGVPQKMVEWVDNLVDGGLDPRPLVVMLLERIDEREAQRDRPPRDAWEALCRKETTKQGGLDLVQLGLRGQRDPVLLQEFVTIAGKKVSVLLTMMGHARAELAELRR